jgi:fibronectin type 3 domain-containing protein
MRFIAVVASCALLVFAVVGHAADRFREGEKLYYDGRFDEAVIALNEAAAQAVDNEKKAAAWLFLGMTRLAQGNPSEAEVAFGRVIALSPGMRLSAKKYPPNVVRLYEAVRARSVGSVSVQTTPSDAKVSVDGRVVGLSPVVIDDLLVGAHAVLIEKEGYRTEERSIAALASERGVFHLELTIADDVPAAVDHQAVAEAAEGRSVRIRATVSDNHGVADVILHYRAADAGEFVETSMEQIERGVYEGVIPRSSVTPAGVSYFITASDVGGNVTNDGMADAPHNIRVAELDKEPPHVFHAPILATSDASKLSIKANVKDNKGLKAVRLFYRRGEDTAYIEERMTEETGGGDFATTVPEAFLDADEILYYLEAVDLSGNIQYAGRADAPYAIRVFRVLPKKDGYIVERKVDADGDPTREVMINVGAMHGVEKDQVFTVFNAADRVVDPETGMVLAINQKLTGKIKVTIPGPASSRARITEEDRKIPMTTGDLIRFKPRAPSGVGGYSLKFRENTVTWNMSPEPEVQSYIVYRSDSLDGPFEEFAKVRGRDKVETVDKGSYRAKLEDGRKYYYRVRAVNDDREESELSKVGHVVAKGGPNPPTHLVAESGLIRKVRLTWKKSDDREAEGYHVLRGTAEEGPFAEIDRIAYPANTEYIDQPDSRKGHVLVDGETYFYRLVSFNKTGKIGNPTETVDASPRQKPTPPADVEIVATGVRSVSLTWSMNPDPEVDRYRVYRHTEPEGTFAMVKEIRDRTETEYTDADKSGANLADGATYYYRLTSVNSGGAESEFSPAVSGATFGPPTPPTGVSAVSGQVKQATVVWSPSPDPEAVGYVVYRGTDPASLTEIKKIRDPKTTTYVDTGSWTERLKDGAVYYYTVVSYNSVEVESQAPTPTAATTKPTPTAPHGLSASRGQGRQVTLRWTANPEPDIAGYRVFRSDRADGGFSLVASSVRETTYVDTNLKNGTAYYYKVQGVDADSLIGAESEATEGYTKPAPTTPVGVTGKAASATEATLTWATNPEPDIARYVIYSAGFFGQKIGETESTSFLVKKLSAGSSYSFQIQAVDVDGLESEKSPPVAVTTPN